MDLRERRWHKIEESSEMRGADHPKKARRVRRRFEPDRLSPTRLADAYEKIVPRYICVLEARMNEAELEQVQERQAIGG
jgi:hypothetical protein